MPTVADNERTYLISMLALSEEAAKKMTVQDLRNSFYGNPPAGGAAFPADYNMPSALAATPPALKITQPNTVDANSAELLQVHYKAVKTFWLNEGGNPRIRAYDNATVPLKINNVDGTSQTNLIEFYGQGGTLSAYVKANGEFISPVQEKFSKIPSQFDTTNTTLTDVPGLDLVLPAGSTYHVTYMLHIVGPQASDAQLQITGTGLFVTLDVKSHGTAATGVSGSLQNQTLRSPNTVLNNIGTLGSTPSFIEMTGIIENPTGATVTAKIQFAQLVAGTTTSILTGSYMHGKKVA